MYCTSSGLRANLSTRNDTEKLIKYSAKFCAIGCQNRIEDRQRIPFAKPIQMVGWWQPIDRLVSLEKHRFYHCKQCQRNCSMHHKIICKIDTKLGTHSIHIPLATYCFGLLELSCECVSLVGHCASKLSTYFTMSAWKCSD